MKIMNDFFSLGLIDEEPPEPESTAVPGLAIETPEPAMAALAVA